jgi:hypothetical protein
MPVQRINERPFNGRSRRRWGQAVASRIFLMLLTCVLSAGAGAAHASIDEAHSAFDALLRRHVAWDAAGVGSSVSYRGLAADRAELGKVLDLYAGVTRADYEAMSRDQRLAFLINLYNAATLELVLGAYPDLKSIRDLGSLMRSPWKQRIVRVFGELRTLDDIEHGMIRAPGAFDDPRIHFVVNCASVGCPALRPEAITAARLQAQLEDSTRRFMRDVTRNRYDPVKGRLEVSKIFDWYRADFERGWIGIGSREQFFGRYADLLAIPLSERARLAEQRMPIGFLDYDWRLNDRR